MKKLFLVVLFQSVFISSVFAWSAFAWVDDSVLVRGELQSVSEKYIVLKTADQSLIRIPKKDSDDIFYGKPLALKRSLDDLLQIRLLKAPAKKVHPALKLADYREFVEEQRRLLNHAATQH